jgi:hypothetical protein
VGLSGLLRVIRVAVWMLPPLPDREAHWSLQVPVRDYFSTILPGLADLPIRRLPDLTPAVWVTRHS